MIRLLAILLKRSVQSFGSDKCATLAAAIAYYTVFALFPMALVGVSLLGFFVSDGSARQQVVNGLASVVSLGDASKEALSQTLAGVSRARGLLGLVGLLTAIWGASGLFGSIRAALDSVWDVDRPLPALRAKLRDLVLFVASGGLLAVSTASTGLVQGVRHLGSVEPLAGPVGWLLSLAVPLLFTFLAFLLLYRLAPHARLGWGDVWPAAAITAVLFDFGKDLLTLYLRHVASLNVLAGSLGAGILFLAFVYYASQVVLFAAEFAKHRMLVNAGTVPATESPTPAPAKPLADKVRDALISLWTVGYPHHDERLPYAPARIDPATHRPASTREDVLQHQNGTDQGHSSRNDRPNVDRRGDGDGRRSPEPTTPGRLPRRSA